MSNDHARHLLHPNGGMLSVLHREAFYLFALTSLMGFVEEEPLAFLGGLTGFLGRVDFLCCFFDKELRDVPADFFTQTD